MSLIQRMYDAYDDPQGSMGDVLDVVIEAIQSDGCLNEIIAAVHLRSNHDTPLSMLARDGVVRHLQDVR